MRFVPARGDEPSQPAFNITPVAGGIIAVCLAVHLLRLALPEAWDRAILYHGGFSPVHFLLADGTLALPLDPLPWLSLVGYAFLHANALHLLVNMGFVLAFATGLERRVGGARMLSFYLVTGLIGLLGTFIVYLVTTAPVLVVGASGAIAGLFGAILRMMAAGPPQRIGDLPRARDRRPVVMAATVFIGVNLFIGVTGLSPDGGVHAIAWEVHITGFVGGWLLFPLFDRPRDRRL